MEEEDIQTLGSAAREGSQYYDYDIAAPAGRFLATFTVKARGGGPCQGLAGGCCRPPTAHQCWPVPSLCADAPVAPFPQSPACRTTWATFLSRRLARARRRRS